MKKKLDYEATKFYSFIIGASDGGGRSTKAGVKITVEDYNDNKPVFDENSYTPSVAENVNIGHTVDTVKATDEDSGPRGSVTYSITGGNVGNAFTISASGRFFVRRRVASLNRLFTIVYGPLLNVDRSVTIVHRPRTIVYRPFTNVTRPLIIVIEHLRLFTEHLRSFAITEVKEFVGAYIDHF